MKRYLNEYGRKPDFSTTIQIELQDEYNEYLQFILGYLCLLTEDKTNLAGVSHEEY